MYHVNKYKDIKITAVFTTLSFLTKKEDYSIADDYKRNNIETMVITGILPFRKLPKVEYFR